MTEKTSIGKKLRGFFVAGLLVLTPLALTVWVVWQLFVGIDGLLNEPISKAFFRSLGVETAYRSIPGLGLLAILLLILLVGFIARNFVGRKIISLGNLILRKIPVVRHIYSTFQQISEAFLTERSDVFKKAVLFEYPRKGIYSIGFITQDTKGLIQDCLSKDVYSLFLPTTPNPTSGYLLFVPKSDVRLLNLSVEEALKLIISGGAIVPEALPLVNGDGIKELEEKNESQS